MKYSVIIPRPVQKEILSIANPFRGQILDKIESLASNPRPIGCKKLKGGLGWRLRVGKYRIIYEIYDKKVEIIIVKVGNRPDIYR